MEHLWLAFDCGAFGLLVRLEMAGRACQNHGLLQALAVARSLWSPIPWFFSLLSAHLVLVVIPDDCPDHLPVFLIPVLVYLPYLRHVGQPVSKLSEVLGLHCPYLVRFALTRHPSSQSHVEAQDAAFGSSLALWWSLALGSFFACLDLWI